MGRTRACHVDMGSADRPPCHPGSMADVVCAAQPTTGSGRNQDATALAVAAHAAARCGRVGPRLGLAPRRRRSRARWPTPGLSAPHAAADELLAFESNSYSRLLVIGLLMAVGVAGGGLLHPLPRPTAPVCRVLGSPGTP